MTIIKYDLEGVFVIATSIRMYDAYSTFVYSEVYKQ